jgi:hypothetical protein
VLLVQSQGRRTRDRAHYPQHDFGGLAATRNGRPTVAGRVVRDLSRGPGFQLDTEEAHTGFEPVLLADALVERVRQKQRGSHGVSSEEKRR